MRKKRFKTMFKKQWKWFLSVGLFLLLGLIALFVGFTLTGWNIVEWVKSPYATTLLIILVVGGIVLLLLVLEAKRRRLGDDE